LAYVKVDPSSLKLEDGFTKDMTDIGHHGTGDLQIRLSSESDLERAKRILKQSYDQS
jgi:predicted transport protein